MKKGKRKKDNAKKIQKEKTKEIKKIWKEDKEERGREERKKEIREEKGKREGMKERKIMEKKEGRKENIVLFICRVSVSRTFADFRSRGPSVNWAGPLFSDLKNYEKKKFIFVLFSSQFHPEICFYDNTIQSRELNHLVY